MSVLKTLSRQYLESPQLIEQQAFESIAKLLDFKEGKAALQDYFKPLSKEEKLKAKMVDPFYSGYRFSDEGEELSSPQDYGVVKVEGPLTYKPEMRMCAPDTCNYQEMVKTVEMYAKQGKKRILMIHDSPGGEAYSMMSSAKNIRAICDEYEIELLGFVDGMSASASYGLLSVCDKVFATEGSSIGSVGVVISLLNNTGALEKAGYKRSFITAGASKVPFGEDGEFKEEFIADLQKSVDNLYEKFTAHVAEFRGISIEDVKATEAKVFDAEEALDLGLIDEIMDVATFKKEYLAEDEGSARLNTDKQETKLMSDPKTPQLSVEELAEIEAMKAELAAFKAKEVEDKKAALSASLDDSGFLAECKEELVAFFMSSEVADETKTLMNSVIDAANTEMTSMVEKAASDINAVREELTADVKAAEKLAEEAKADAEAVKEEFATTKFAETSETKDINVALSHEEKIAQAVAAEKAKRNAK